MAAFTRHLGLLFKDYLLHNTTRGASKVVKTLQKVSPKDGSRTAAVLCCLKEDKDGEIDVLINIRSDSLSRSPGDACFPGGMVDPTDSSVEDAALREAEEEINLKRDQVEVISTLPPSIMGTRGEIIQSYAVICTLHDDTQLDLQPNEEVQDVFWMPLKTFLTNDSKIHKQVQVMYKKTIPMFIDYFTVPVSGVDRTVWGLTARVCITIATIVYSRHPSFPHSHYYISSTDADSINISQYFLPPYVR